MNKEMMQYLRELKEEMEKRNRWERKKTGILIWIAIVITMMFIFCLFKPAPSAYDVEKYVYDIDGTPIRGATVTLYYDEEHTTIYDSKTTNCHGKVIFRNVPYGEYWLNVSYFYNGEWYYEEEHIVVDSDKELENYLNLHIGKFGGGL